jgi:hypothetical protein
MDDFIWQWNKGSAKFYTRDSTVAEEAMRSGMLVIGKKLQPRIMRY